MLGHRVWIELSRDYEVWATLHGSADEVPPLPAIDRSRVCELVDVLDAAALEGSIVRTNPDVIVNCVGMVKQHQFMNDAVRALRLNSVLPREVARIAADSGARVIQMSTDCVFSGRQGNYDEESPVDADDLYGVSKYLGELPAPHLTIRTSIIGRELRTSHGLTEWFLGQRGSVRGFTRAIFSGLSTRELARVIGHIVLPQTNLAGVYHVSGPVITKYDLLHLMKRVYRREIEITADDSLVLDRSLNPAKFARQTGYGAPSWEHMLGAESQPDVPYDAVRPSFWRSGN